MSFEVVVNIINDAAYQARNICGSEGLYQCIIYDLAKRSPQIQTVEREFPISLTNGKTGYIDFVLESDDMYVAIELKAGANSHRNSLDKAKEVDSKFGAEKSGGLLKDFDKLETFLRADHKKAVRAISVCLETAFIKYGFSSEDVARYSELANRKSIDFVYGTPGSEPFNLWITSSERRKVQLEPNIEKRAVFPSDFDLNQFDWKSFFSEIGKSKSKDEKYVQGEFYHHLRKMGLTETQCASEVFFHCAKKPESRASYWLPDIAVFSPDFNGRFNLGVDNLEKSQNDYEKLRHLNAIIEIKGSDQFEKASISKKIELIQQDLDKLNNRLRSQIDAKLLSKGIKRENPIKYIMVIASNDTRLTNFALEAQAKYGKNVQIFWPGSCA